MKSIDTMLREVVVTLKEEQACLELWFNDKSVNEDVRRGVGISLTKISEALGKLAALEKGDDHGKADSLATVSDDSRDNDGDLITVDAAFGEANVTDERRDVLIGGLRKS